MIMLCSCCLLEIWSLNMGQSTKRKRNTYSQRPRWRTRRLPFPAHSVRAGRWMEETQQRVRLLPSPQGQAHLEQVILGPKVDELRPFLRLHLGQGGLWARPGTNQATRGGVPSAACSPWGEHPSVRMGWGDGSRQSVAEMGHRPAFWIALPPTGQHRPASLPSGNLLEYVASVFSSFLFSIYTFIFTLSGPFVPRYNHKQSQRTSGFCSVRKVVFNWYVRAFFLLEEETKLEKETLYPFSHNCHPQP